VSEHISNEVSQVADAAITKTIGLGAAGVGIGTVNYLELFQSGLVSVGSIAGAILVIWGLIDKIKITLKKRQQDIEDRNRDA